MAESLEVAAGADKETDDGEETEAAERGNDAEDETEEDKLEEEDGSGCD